MIRGQVRVRQRISDGAERVTRVRYEKNPVNLRLDEIEKEGPRMKYSLNLL